MGGSGILRLSVLVAIATLCCNAIGTAQATVAKSVKPSSQQPPVNQSDLTAKGIEAFERDETETARKFLELALKSKPRNALAHKYLGILDDRAGDLKNAKTHFQAAAYLEPKSSSARNNYGAILLKLNRPSEAAKEFEASLRLDAKQTNALVNLAQIRYNENTSVAMQASFDLFERATALAADALVERSLIIIALRLEKKNEAEKHYRIYAAQLAAEKNPPTAANRVELGRALYEGGLLQEAETELKSALAADASNSDAIVSLGKVYFQQDDIKSAGLLLETAVARNYATAAIYSLLSRVYEKAGRYENAIPAMRRAIDLQPDSENYRFQYGLLLTDADAPAAAIIRLDEALKTFPASPRLWLARGIADLKNNKNIEAVESIGKAIELDPKFAQGYAYLGLANMQVGDNAKAIGAYEKALASDPTLGIVHQLIAEAMLQQADSDGARIEAELKKSIALAADFAPAYLTLGKLYIRTQRWTDAAASLNEVVRRTPETTEAYYHLGRVYARLKRKTEAEAALKKFKTLSESQKTKSENDLREITRRLANVRF